MGRAEKVYDGEIKVEVEGAMKSNLSSSIKKAISETFWYIGHELADDRDDGVIAWGSALASLAEKYDLIGLGQSAKDFVNLYQSETEERELRRKKEAEKERKMYTPEKTVAEDLAKLDPNCDFPGHQPIYFNALYGKLTIPDSQYGFFYGYPSSKKRLYIIGEDDRTAGQIWASLEKSMAERINEMLAKEIVTHEVNALTDYAGPLENIHVLIGKELIIPKKITEARLKKEEERRRNPPKPFESGAEMMKALREMKIPDPYDVMVCETLKEEGIRLGNKTIVEVSAWSPTRMDQKLSDELFGMAFEVLEKEGYRTEHLPWLSSGWNPYGPGTSRTEIDQIGSCSEMYVGEMKLIEPLLPCGRTKAEVHRIWDAAWGMFKGEVKEIEGRELTGIEEAKIVLEEYGITFSEGKPIIPCTSRKGENSCAPGVCHRGKYITKGKAESLEDLLDDEHKEKLERIKKLTSEAWRSSEEAG